MPEQTLTRVLRIDSSARRADSVSRELGDEIVRRLQALHPGMRVERLDLADGVAHIDADWVVANLTPPDERDPAQQARLATSDAMVHALSAADAVVLTAPVYNFAVPSTLKAWVDHVCRAGLTFQYTAQGPRGLLHDRPVYLAMASGGVPFGGDVDFASTYLKQVLGFIGIHDVRLVGAAGVARNGAAARQTAEAQLDTWLPDRAGRAA